MQTKIENNQVELANLLQPLKAFQVMKSPDLSSIPSSPVSSVAEYVQRVVETSAAMGLAYGNLWFRGVAKKELKLVPGVFWRSVTDEGSILEEFMVSLPAYSAKNHDDPWELYSLMQHCGLPTRLLDWSKSPLAALFFALDFDESKAAHDQTPVVWVMNPYALNYFSHSKEALFVPLTRFGRSGDETLVDPYLPMCLRPFRVSPDTGLGSLPIAVEPPFSNPRVLAQQGCFTVHGSDARALEDIPGMAAHLVTIEIAPEKTPDLRDELEQLGFRAEWMYQDVDRLSKRIIAERCAL